MSSRVADVSDCHRKTVEGCDGCGRIEKRVDSHHGHVNYYCDGEGSTSKFDRAISYDSSPITTKSEVSLDD